MNYKNKKCTSLSNFSHTKVPQNEWRRARYTATLEVSNSCFFSIIWQFLGKIVKKSWNNLEKKTEKCKKIYRKKAGCIYTLHIQTIWEGVCGGTMLKQSLVIHFTLCLLSPSHIFLALNYNATIQVCDCGLNLKTLFQNSLAKHC